MLVLMVFGPRLEATLNMSGGATVKLQAKSITAEPPPSTATNRAVTVPSAISSRPTLSSMKPVDESTSILGGRRSGGLKSSLYEIA